MSPFRAEDFELGTPSTDVCLFYFILSERIVLCAMAGSCSGRKCSGFGAVGVGHWESKVGPSTPRPPSSEKSHPVPDGSAGTWSAAAIIVVLIVAVALVGMIVLVLILRRRRIREEQMRNGVAQSGNVAKGGPGEEDVNTGGKWSAGAVELVVMAGETKPTFLAHPVPTPTTHPIQCPPLILPKDNASQSSLS